MVYVVDFKNLIENVKNGIETIVSPVIPFNLADIKNKDYLFVLDSYKIIKEFFTEEKALTEITGKVLKPCNLQGAEAESGYFHFGLQGADIKNDLVTINFNNNVEILGDFTKISYGFGAMQLINFKGFAYCNLVNLSEAEPTAGAVKQVIIDVMDATDSIDLEKIEAGEKVQEKENWVKVNY
jgi:hypothetical protein